MFKLNKTLRDEIVILKAQLELKDKEIQRLHNVILKLKHPSYFKGVKHDSR